VGLRGANANPAARRCEGAGGKPRPRRSRPQACGRPQWEAARRRQVETPPRRRRQWRQRNKCSSRCNNAFQFGNAHVACRQASPPPLLQSFTRRRPPPIADAVCQRLLRHARAPVAALRCLLPLTPRHAAGCCFVAARLSHAMSAAAAAVVARLPYATRVGYAPRELRALRALCSPPQRRQEKGMMVGALYARSEVVVV